MTRTIATVRGLGPPESFSVSALDRRTLIQAYDRFTSDQEWARQGSVGIALGYWAPGVDVAAEWRSASDPGGFYQRANDQIVLLREATGKLSAAQIYILAHEIEHSLQNHRLRVPAFNTIVDSDRRMAVAALSEGDAELTATATIAALVDTPLSDVLRMRLNAGEQYYSAKDPLPFAQNIVRFQYEAGLAFVAELYRQGRFAMVNDAFLRLPASTEQILHVEKYLADDPPLPLEAPKAPANYKVVASTRMGEIGIKAILSLCMSESEAGSAARNWGGDALTVVERDGEWAFSFVLRWIGLPVTTDQGEGKTYTVLTEGEEHRWSFTGRKQARARVLPVCEGRGMLVFVEAWDDDGGRAELESWIQSFKPTGDRPAVCQQPLIEQ